MDENSPQLKEKVMLLMQRERELFGMRRQLEQVTQWLKLTQSLPALFEPGLAPSEMYVRVRKALISGLRVQRVAFFHLSSESLIPIAPAGAERTISAPGRELLSTSPSGHANGPTTPGERALADAVGLELFLWSLRPTVGGLPVLLVAGFSRDKAGAQTPFDENTAAHIDNTAAHIAAMFENHALVSELRAANEHLEGRVNERTAELAERNRDLHLVLDNVDQAFLTIDRSGQLSREHSAIGERWFGAYAEDARFAEYISRVDAAFAMRFRHAYAALLEDVLPEEVCLYQIPTRLRGQHGEYECKYFPLKDPQGITGLVIVISDVTEQVRRAQSEAEHTELLALFQCFMRDRAGYLTFVHEASAIIEDLTRGTIDEATQKRLLHTLKGTAAGIGAHLLSRLCHRAEDQLNGDAQGSVSVSIDELARRWTSIVSAMRLVGDSADYETVEVPIHGVAQTIEHIRHGRTDAALEQLALWRSEPAVQPLARLGKIAQELAHRLGKGQLEIALSAPEVRLDFQKWSSLFAGLVHVVRNAVDHGLELTDERRALHKPAKPMLDLRMRHAEEQFVIEIEDDGRGIDWNGVRSAASARGLPHETQDELQSALFAPGITTRADVTTTSGRGIGLSAIHAEVLSLGGSVTVRSQPQRGTCWTFSLPLSERLPFYSASVARRP
jgi:HPt (histidine-containing phosphotransfer) domain-containing protein